MKTYEGLLRFQRIFLGFTVIFLGPADSAWDNFLWWEVLLSRLGKAIFLEVFINSNAIFDALFELNAIFDHK